MGGMDTVTVGEEATAIARLAGAAEEKSDGGAITVRQVFGNRADVDCKGWFIEAVCCFTEPATT